MGKRERLPRDTFDGVLYRQAEITRDDAEDGSIAVTIATETPVEVYDFARRQVIREVLLVDGIEHAAQMPIVDSHDRSSVRNVLGSLRGLERSDGAFVGRAYFSAKGTAQEARQDVIDGHVTDFSVTARRLESVFVPEGATQIVNGKSYEGPTRVVTRSRALDGSIVAIGADPSAKVMRAYTAPRELEESEMADVLRELCVSKGMPEDIEDVKRWADENLTAQKPADTVPAEPAEEVERTEAEPVAEPITTPTTPDPRAELKRALDIKNICRQHGVGDEQADKWVMDNLTVDQVARNILESRKPGDKPIGGPTAVESETDKFLAAASAGVTMRTLQGARVDPSKALDQARGKFNGVQTSQIDHDAVQRSEQLVELMQKPPAGYRDFRYMSCADIAREFLHRAGERVDGLPRHEIVRRAIKHQGLIERSSAAYHTTGSFPQLMLDAANKTLLAAYDEASVTYPMWVRTAPSASDFKSLNRTRFGELPDPEVVPENFPYPEKSPSDSKESYRVEKHGEIFSISLEAMVNDDLNALSRIPAMQGNAMRRKVNRTVYAILTDNAALSDGIALFHATSHGANLDATALSATALNTAFTVMMTQSGLNSTTILNIMPRYLIVPAALSATALQIVNSTADPTVGGATTGSSGVANIYGPGGPRMVMPVIEGQLDASSTTAWYMAADPSQVDTVELTFLQGEESPVLEREDGFETDCIKWKIRQTFAAKAIDYRGLYQGNS